MRCMSLMRNSCRRADGINESGEEGEARQVSSKAQIKMEPVQKEAMASICLRR